MFLISCIPAFEPIHIQGQMLCGKLVMLKLMMSAVSSGMIIYIYIVIVYEGYTKTAYAAASIRHFYGWWLTRCRLVRQTPCACSPAVDGSVLIVIMRVHRCFHSDYAPRLLLGVGGLSVLCCFIGAEWSNLHRVCVGSGGFLSCLCRVLEEQLSDV